MLYKDGGVDLRSGVKILLSQHVGILDGYRVKERRRRGEREEDQKGSFSEPEDRDNVQVDGAGNSADRTTMASIPVALYMILSNLSSDVYTQCENFVQKIHVYMYVGRGKEVDGGHTATERREKLRVGCSHGPARINLSLCSRHEYHISLAIQRGAQLLSTSLFFILFCRIRCSVVCTMYIYIHRYTDTSRRIREKQL